MVELVTTMAWTRLDTKGSDACRLFRHENGWRIAGIAVFSNEGKPCCLGYNVECDYDWQARSADISGWSDAEDLALKIRKGKGETWLLNEVEQPQVQGCTDVDLGFTPATNLIALRRLSMRIGDTKAAPAVYLRFPELDVVLLEQSYERIGPREYNYGAPAYDYSGVLEVSEEGFVVKYPGLWEGCVS